MTDEELAERLARGAGRLLLDLRAQDFAQGPALGALGDKVANAFILTSLAQWRPLDPVLSEESADRPERLQSRRLWIIDPLDGTREYSEGRDDWAVHVALAVDGAPALGVVALPASGRLFPSASPPPAAAPSRERPVMVVSRTRPPARAAGLAAFLGADLLPMGSAGAKAAAVIAGEADLYFHEGGQHEWDNCAPAAAAIAAGLQACRSDGSPLRYNRADTLVPDLLIARPDLAARALAYLAR